MSHGTLGCLTLSKHHLFGKSLDCQTDLTAMAGLGLVCSLARFNLGSPSFESPATVSTGLTVREDPLRAATGNCQWCSCWSVVKSKQIGVMLWVVDGPRGQAACDDGKLSHVH
jgi:hypothetical protein